MPTGLDLREQRGRVVDQMREITDTAENEDRTLSEDERARFDELERQFAELGERTERTEAQEARERELNAPARTGSARTHDRSGDAPLDEQFRELGRGERRAVVVNFADEDTRGHRDLLVGTDTAGGYTVPTTFVARLYEFMVERASVRRTNVTTMTTTSGETMQVPKLTGHSQAQWIGEAATIPESDPTFGQIELNAYKAGKMLQLSSELLADSAINVLDVVARDAGYALGELTGAAYLTGTGTGQPAGILSAVTAGATDSATTAALTYDLLYTLFFSVIEPYRQNSYWMMNDNTMQQLVTIKDADGYSILQRDVTSGFPMRLFGRPIVTDHNMPDVASGNRSVLFGWFGAYYIRDVGQMRFERSNDWAFDQDLITFRSLMRTDGRLVDTSGAIKALVHS
jgi:HK97 family phage major capsid protein